MSETMVTRPTLRQMIEQIRADMTNEAGWDGLGWGGMPHQTLMTLMDDKAGWRWRRQAEALAAMIAWQSGMFSDLWWNAEINSGMMAVLEAIVPPAEIRAEVTGIIFDVARKVEVQIESLSRADGADAETGVAE